MVLILADMKELQIIQTEESPKTVRIVSDSKSVLLCITNIQPAIPLKSADESDIINHLAAMLHDEGYQVTFTRCPSHCGVVGNEMADKQALNGTADNQDV